MNNLKFFQQTNLLFLLVFLTFQSCHPVKIKDSHSSFYPYHFENIQVKLVKIQYKIDPHGPITRHSRERIIPDSLIYRARVVLKFYPDTLIWKKPVLLLVETGRKTQNFWFNKKQAPLSNSKKRIFGFTFKTKFNEPWARFTLAVPAREEGEYVPDYQNIFRSHDLELPTEVKQQINY